MTMFENDIEPTEVSDSWRACSNNFLGMVLDAYIPQLANYQIGTRSPLQNSKEV